MSKLNITFERYILTHLSNIIRKIEQDKYYNLFKYEVPCMDVIKRIDFLMKERNWSDYKLATESGLSSSTIANIHRRNTVPSIATLEAICSAFGITLAQFFTEETSTVQLNKEQQNLFNVWVTLTEHQKQIIYSLIKELK